MRRAVARTRPVHGTVTSRSPPASVPVTRAAIISISPADADVDEAGAVSQRVAPTSRIRVVNNAESPGERTWIVINRPNPLTIHIARSVNHSSIISVGANVAGRVSHVNDLGSCAVNLNVAHVIHRTARRNCFHGIRHAVGHNPRPLRPRSDEPYGVVAHVILAADF